MARRRIACLAIALAVLPGVARSADEPVAAAGGGDWADEGARFAAAMARITQDVSGAVVTSRDRTDADQAQLAAVGYRPHPRSQHKLGLAWDVAASATALDTLRARAIGEGFTALVMKSPVTGVDYLHVQRFVRSPLWTETAEPVALAESQPDAADDAVAAAPPGPLPVVEPPRPLPGSRLDLPRRLLRTKVDGRIVLLLHVSEEGRVLDLAVAASDLPDFDDVVKNEVSGWSFSPPLLDGRPVATFARLPIPIRVR
jgi:Gram-negative bacterial TonB protein C-terminal